MQLTWPIQALFRYCRECGRAHPWQFLYEEVRGVDTPMIRHRATTAAPCDHKDVP